jgi:putative transposase
VARQLRLKPINTPVCSPQSNGMAESFVNTFRRDYVSRMDLSDAPTVMAQVPAAFKHFNEIQMKSLREFRRLQAAQARQVQQQEPALRCD